MNARAKDRSSGYTDVARTYAEQVVAGEILACRWVQRACQRQLDDMTRYKGKASPYRFNPKLTEKQGRSFYPADNLCAFIERLPHVKGPLAGEPIRLEPWQVFIVSTVFGWVKAEAERARRLGFGAKLCIHPKQIAAVHQGFAPTAAQLEWARRVLAAAEA